MGTAYTPGLTVSANAVVRKLRRLPLAGEVLVSVGDSVEADTPVARALLPGDLVSVRAADQLGLEPSELADALKVEIGAEVAEGDVLAEMKGLFGLFTSRVKAPTSGTLEFASGATGHIGIRRAPTPVEVTAFVKGTVAEVSPPDSVTVQTMGARVQGVFGVGGETSGTVVCVTRSADATLAVADLPHDLSGKIVVGGAWAEPEAWDALAKRGAAGLIVGSLRDSDLKKFLGYDLGLAITGGEDVPYTVLVTEGFGRVAMSSATYRLLKTLDGRLASLSGQTQIRAGAVRPELIAPLETGAAGPEGGAMAEGGELAVGSRVRLIRHPHFGAVAEVVELPEEPVGIGTGAKVRVLVARTEDGSALTIPRSNVELFVG